MSSLPPNTPAPNPAQAPAYPLQVEPVFVERVWGREDLTFLYATRPAKPGRVGEVWLTGTPNKIANGPWAGVPLEEVAGQFPKAVLGPSVARIRPTHGPAFPLLIKFLFTTQKLSVQVHPTDSYAREREGSRGKTEMWHIVRAEPGARLAVGFREELEQGPRWSHGDLKNAVESGEIEGLLDWREIHPGETFYVPAGTVHTIGPGVVLCEVQQNSDITYRFYDYKRPGTDGKLRPLHIEQALDVLKWRTSGGRTQPVEIEPDSSELLAASPYFTTERIPCSTPIEHAVEGTVEIWVALEGEAQFEGGGETAVCRRGEAVVLPAALETVQIKPTARTVFLRTFPPEPDSDIRAPWMAQGFSEEQLSRVCFPRGVISPKGRG